MVFKEIAFGSDEFLEECRLRNEVLRVPLGLSVHDEDIEKEKDQMHFGLFARDGEIAACVIAAPMSSTEAKIRQMAVRPGHQGKGFGRVLIRSLEENFARRAFTHLFLHARMSAIPFYEKMGYEKAGDEFVEVGIPHLKMEK